MAVVTIVNGVDTLVESCSSRDDGQVSGQARLFVPAFKASLCDRIHLYPRSPLILLYKVLMYFFFLLAPACS